MKIKKAIQQTTYALSTISTARLDAELLLSLCLQCDRTYLYTYPEQMLTEAQIKKLKELTARRQHGEPMAYILGYKEFWSLPFLVTSDVLIPRPETEHLIEWVLKNFNGNNYLVADLGTGSGAIAITLAKEKPHWTIDAIDISNAALRIAKKNANILKQPHINFFQGNWCQTLPRKNYNLIISNPPYLAKDDPHLTTLQFEPWRTALASGDEGLDAICEIITEAYYYLTPGGYLIIEHGYQQSNAVLRLFTNAGYIKISAHLDLAGHPRFCTAMRPDENSQSKS